MILQLEDSKSIEDIQKQFSFFFPFLKIEFFTKRHIWEGMYKEHELLPGSLLLGSIRKQHNSGAFEIKPWHKIGEVENEFYLKFGLNVQIYFKSGKRWIQTTKSDNLTIFNLQMQTNKAETPLL